MDNYVVGVKLTCNGITGIIVENYKFPGDICIDWENGIKSSYDRDWLDENATIID